MYQHLTKLLLAGVVAVAVLALGSTLLNPFPRQALAQGFECDEGKTVLILVLPDGTEKSICVPAAAVEGIENAGDNAAIDFVSEKTVFVTSLTFTGDLIRQADDLMGSMAATGLEAGDLICQWLADDADVGGTYRAWLSDSFISAADRFAHADLPYVRTDGAVVAGSWTDLTSFGDLRSPINHDESGRIVLVDPGASDSGVWTGTRFDGTSIGPGQNCGNWILFFTFTGGRAEIFLSIMTFG